MPSPYSQKIERFSNNGYFHISLNHQAPTCFYYIGQLFISHVPLIPNYKRRLFNTVCDITNKNNLGRFFLRFGDENPNKPDNVAYLCFERSTSHVIAIRELDELWFGNHYFGKYLKAVANGFTNSINNSAFKIQNFSNIRLDVTNWNKRHYVSSVENNFFYLPKDWRSVIGIDEPEQANIFQRNRHLNENNEDDFENRNGGYYNHQGEYINENGEHDVNVTVWAHEMDNNNNDDDVENKNGNFMYINKTGLNQELAQRITYPNRYFHQALGSTYHKRDRELSDENLATICSTKATTSKKWCNVQTPPTSQTTQPPSSPSATVIDLTTDDDESDQIVLDELIKLLVVTFLVKIKSILMFQMDYIIASRDQGI